MKTNKKLMLLTGLLTMNVILGTPEASKSLMPKKPAGTNNAYNRIKNSKYTKLANQISPYISDVVDLVLNHELGHAILIEENNGEVESVNVFGFEGLTLSNEDLNKFQDLKISAGGMAMEYGCGKGEGDYVCYEQEDMKIISEILDTCDVQLIKMSSNLCTIDKPIPSYSYLCIFDKSGKRLKKYKCSIPDELQRKDIARQHFKDLDLDDKKYIIRALIAHIWHHNFKSKNEKILDFKKNLLSSNKLIQPNYSYEDSVFIAVNYLNVFNKEIFNEKPFKDNKELNEAMLDHYVERNNLYYDWNFEESQSQESKKEKLYSLIYKNLSDIKKISDSDYRKNIKLLDKIIDNCCPKKIKDSFLNGITAYQFCAREHIKRMESAVREELNRQQDKAREEINSEAKKTGPKLRVLQEITKSRQQEQDNNGVSKSEQNDQGHSKSATK